MATAFDIAASAYDENFTHSVIGNYQRGQVYRHLSEFLTANETKSILEINCGTGEDAAWLSAQKYVVTATDISENMIAVARKKTADAKFLTVDINAIASEFNGKKLDLIFSNFGGLNCLNPEQLQAFFKNIPDLLTDNGKLILVMMPKNTLWEKLYYFAKRDFKNASRRDGGNALTYVEGEFVDTYYYNPSTLVSMANPAFNVRQIKPVGFFVPPSYLEPQMAKRRRFAALLDRLDHTIGWPLLAKFADHFFITFEKR